jgi:hypothetical protein
MIPVLPLGHLDVSQAVKQLDAHPQVWNRHSLRREAYVHQQVDDIWVRYNAWENFTGDAAAFNGPHESVWYPVVHEVPALWSLARQAKRMACATQLGGVLVTRIPPGGSVAPHIDRGWHAETYRKLGVQIAGHEQQVFWWDDGERTEHRPLTGDVYEFRNDVLHGVDNDSPVPRITLIVCCK